MEITSIKQYKGSTYEVMLDDNRKIYLHIDIITDFGLCSGMTLEKQKLRQIIYASNSRRAFQYALHLLDYRDYSFKEMFGKLEKTYKNEDMCFAVMNKLVKIGVINDKRYAEKLARKYVEAKRFGFRRAKQEMFAKGISIEITEAALGEYSELFAENLNTLLENKYARLLTDESDRKSVEKVKNSLVRYGYSYSEINSAIRTYFEDESIYEQ